MCVQSLNWSWRWSDTRDLSSRTVCWRSHKLCRTETLFWNTTSINWAPITPDTLKASFHVSSQTQGTASLKQCAVVQDHYNEKSTLWDWVPKHWMQTRPHSQLTGVRASMVCRSPVERFIQMILMVTSSLPEELLDWICGSKYTVTPKSPSKITMLPLGERS